MESATESYPRPETELVNGHTLIESRRQLLEFKQLELVYHYSPLTMGGALLTLVIMLFVMEPHISGIGLIAWGGALFGLYMLRLVYIVVYRRCSLDSRYQYTKFWRRLFLSGTVVTGLAWGLGVVWFMPAAVEVQMFLTLIIGGLGAAASVTYAAVRIAGPAFTIPALVPVTLYYLSSNTDTSLAFGLLCVLFLVLMILASQQMYETIRIGLKYANDNKQLVSELQHTNRIVVKLNQDLHRENVERRQAEERFRRLSDASSEGVLIHNQGTIVDANRRLVDMLGYEYEEFIGTHVLSHVAEESREAAKNRLVSTGAETNNLPHDEKPGLQIYAKRRDNSEFPIEFHGKDVPFGEVTLRVVLVKDLSRRLEAESALNMEKERALVTLESIGDGVATTDSEGIINYINPVAEELSGWSKQDSIGKYLADILRLRDQRSNEMITDPVANCLISENKIILSGEILLQGTRSTQNFSIEVTISPIRDVDQKIIGTVLVFHDVTVLHTMARQMSHQATHDALTGLINRSEFEHRLNALLESARRGEHHHAMCYLDLDEFKVVNDTSGHAAGDRLLQDISARLEAGIRESDTLARLGGDEFGVLLEGCPLEKARQISEDLRKVVKGYRLIWEEHVYEVGVSIGLVPIDADSGELSDILRAADSACYVAKDRGRNRVHVYEKDDAELAKHHGNMRWMQKIQRALEAGDFRLYCQPIRDTRLSDTRSWHAEILLRMVDANGYSISPEMFMSAAERYHLMVDVDSWVVKQSLKDLAQLIKVLPYESCLCAINLSGQSLSDDDFLGFLVSEIERSGISPQSLCFEITETTAISNIDYAQRFITTVRSMGCKFALDDFGSGLSSFAYLKRLPVDFLKIDGSFIRNICNDETDYAMVKSIQQIGNVMKIETVAEFVESKQIIERLQELGVDYVQGYAIGEPQPLDVLIDDYSRVLKNKAR